MTVRTTKAEVTFARPFVLTGVDRELPAGTYHVETDEQLIEGPSFPVYRRIATVIQLPVSRDRPGVLEFVMIDPAELDAAVARDCEHAAENTG